MAIFAAGCFGGAAMAARTRQLNLSRLQLQQRQRVWKRIQQHPEIVAWLDDPFVVAAREAFDADVIIQEFRTQQEIRDDDRK